VGVPRAQPLAPLSVLSCQELPSPPLAQEDEGEGVPQSPEGDVTDEFDQELLGAGQEPANGEELVAGQETNHAAPEPPAALHQAPLLGSAV